MKVRTPSPSPASTAPNATILGLVPFPISDTIVDPRPTSARLEAAIEKVKVEAKHDRPYAEFEDIGLLAPKPLTKTAQKLVVSGYRLLGFAILSIIVIVLVGYIATTAFYYLSRSWITPVEISPSDDKVVALQAQLASQLNERAKLAGDFDQAERAIAAEQTFQLAFIKAIKKDVEGRRLALGRVQQLSQAAASTRAEIRRTNGAYSAQTVSRMNNEYAAGMIDRQQMLAGKYQLAQITTANLSLAERQAEFDQRAAELSAETQSLDSLLGDKSQSVALSYDVLKIQREYEASKLQLAKDLEDRERLKGSLEREDKIIEGVRNSAYLKALADHATVALVPYGNLDHVAKGTTLYACKLSMVICHEVGTVIALLPGEVMVKHPHGGSILRGKMLEMKMTEDAAAQDEVLFAGGAPLGL